MAMVFRRYPAGGGERLLALALADCAHADGTRIFPSVRLLAQMSALSERSVQRQITAMLASGWLVLVRRANGRPGAASEYRISPQWLAGGAPVPPERPPERATKARLTGDKLAPVLPVDKLSTRVTSTTETGDIAVSPYPSVPVIEETPPAPPTGGAPAAKPAEDPGPDSAAGFEVVAAAYPRRAKLHLARVVWAELQPDAAMQAAMLRGIERWKADAEWQREGGRFVPRLHEWLRDQRWLDDKVRAAPPPVGAMAAPPMAPLPAKAPVPDAVRALSARLRGQMRGEVRVGA